MFKLSEKKQRQTTGTRLNETWKVVERNFERKCELIERKVVNTYLKFKVRRSLYLYLILNIQLDQFSNGLKALLASKHINTLKTEIYYLCFLLFPDVNTLIVLNMCSPVRKTRIDL